MAKKRKMHIQRRLGTMQKAELDDNLLMTNIMSGKVQTLIRNERVSTGAPCDSRKRMITTAH